MSSLVPSDWSVLSRPPVLYVVVVNACFHFFYFQLNIKKFNVELKGGIWGYNSASSLCAVGKLWWTDKSSFLTFLHLCK
jgi:hypothetical protein